MTPGEARGYLARFLFRGDDVFKEVRALSGGERSRLELALLGILPSNLLLLDEPTNHLDIAAREAIEAFLTEAPATIIVVSHDRRLLETICERLWVVDDGLAVPFDGGYRAWRAAVADGWTVEAEAARPGEPWPAGIQRRGTGPPSGAGARPRGGDDARAGRRPPAAVAVAGPSEAPEALEGGLPARQRGARQRARRASACARASSSSPWACRRSPPTSSRCDASRASSRTSSVPWPRPRTRGCELEERAP